MKPFLRSIGLLLAWAALLRPGSTLAQTPTLEFAASVGNPTGNGPSIANQVITFQNNTNNPSGITFAGFTPTTRATFSLSNQQYTQTLAKIATQTGLAFGATITPAGSQLATASPLFTPLSSVGGSVDAQYSSANGVTGGISATNPASNSAVELFTSVEPLPTNVPANSRYQYADLTITFNQPMVNPVVHVTGLGGTYGGGVSFTTELDLVSAGVTLSKLDGSTELAVTPKQILNNATTFGATTGAGAASGSILVTTSSAGVSVLQFRVYLRPAATGGDIHTTDNSRHTGDAWLISVSELTPAPVATAKTITVNNPGSANSVDVSNGFAGTDSQPGTLTSLTLTTFPTNATSITISGTKYTGAAAFNAASVAVRTLATNGDGTLAAGQTVAVDPATDNTLTSVLPFTVTDVQGVTSAAANLTINFTPNADVTTSVTGPATLNTSQLSGNYTATFTNTGTLTASGVTQKVTLPAGVTNVALPAGATLSGSTIDFGGATLTAGASNSFVFSFTAPGTPSAIAIISNVSTTSSEGTNAAPNSNTLNVTVNKSTPPTSCAPSYFDGTNAYSGLSAEYYSGDYNGVATYFNGKNPSQKRVDPTLNFPGSTNFGDLTATGTKPNGADTDNQGPFSARYLGSLSIATASSYTFYLSSDDKSNLWLDGAALTPTTSAPLVSATYGPNNTTPASIVTVNLSAGFHNLTVYYGNIGGPAYLTLEYSSTTAGITRQIIPNSVLCAGKSNVPPLAVNKTNVAIPNNNGPTTLNPSLAGTDQDGTVAKYAIASLPTAAQGVLRLNGTAVTLNQVITAAEAATLTFQPTFGSAAGNVTFTFSAIDDKGQYSNDVATYTIPVTAAADLSTTLAGPALLNAGQPSGNFTGYVHQQRPERG